MGAENTENTFYVFGKKIGKYSPMGLHASFVFLVLFLEDNKAKLHFHLGLF